MSQRIGYLGPEGTFTGQAARAMSSGGDELIPLAGTDEIECELLERRIDAGVLPLMNSRAGGVQATGELIERLGDKIRITGDHTLPVTFRLFRKVGDEATLREVLSHPKALSQCAAFIARAGASMLETSSTAQACELVAAADEIGLGAIAAPGAGTAYGLVELPEPLEDETGAMTRFVRLELA
ncbi:MAG: prephenate dehydratase domain-containing protein [Phycisphaerales bacterium]